ncbi:MAG: hypothetical protein ABIF10_03170 [Candidatus Woesearchaeota archaeon]
MKAIAYNLLMAFTRSSQSRMTHISKQKWAEGLEERADVLAVDDHKAINMCKIYSIPFMTALTFVIFAHNRKLANKTQAREMIDNLSVFGRYKSESIHDAYKLAKSEIK